MALTPESEPPTSMGTAAIQPSWKDLQAEFLQYAGEHADVSAVWRWVYTGPTIPTAVGIALSQGPNVDPGDVLQQMYRHPDVSSRPPAPKVQWRLEGGSPAAQDLFRVIAGRAAGRLPNPSGAELWRLWLDRLRAEDYAPEMPLRRVFAQEVTRFGESGQILGPYPEGFEDRHIEHVFKASADFCLVRSVAEPATPNPTALETPGTGEPARLAAIPPQGAAKGAKAERPVLPLETRAAIERTVGKVLSVRSDLFPHLFSPVIRGSLGPHSAVEEWPIHRKPATLKTELQDYAFMLFMAEAEHYPRHARDESELLSWLSSLASCVEAEVITETDQWSHLFNSHCSPLERRLAIAERLKQWIESQDAEGLKRWIDKQRGDETTRTEAEPAVNGPSGNAADPVAAERETQRDRIELPILGNEAPLEFDQIARAKVVAAEIEASRAAWEPSKFTTTNGLIPGTPYRVEAGRIFQYILTVFAAFANEACVLGRKGVWSADKVDRESREFLRLMTMEAQAKYGPRSECHLPEMTSPINGSLMPLIHKFFETSPEWQRYQHDLLQVAKVHSKQGNLGALAGDVATLPHMAGSAKVSHGAPLSAVANDLHSGLASDIGPQAGEKPGSSDKPRTADVIGATKIPVDQPANDPHGSVQPDSGPQAVGKPGSSAKPGTTVVLKAPARTGAASPPQGIPVGAMREASAPSPVSPTGATDSALSELGYRAPKRGKRGLESDDSGHKRVAEMLADYPQWAENLKEACVLLANPPDGKPAPAISQAWRHAYKITGYGEVYENIGEKEIRQHLARRLDLGRELLARNSRQ